MPNDERLLEVVNDFCPSDHEFPLHYVLSLYKHYYFQFINKMKDKYDINTKDHSGNTPLHIMALHCDYSEQCETESVISEIIRLGVEINTINKNGDTLAKILTG